MDPVVHFEIPYEDPVRVTRFYEAVFGWRTQLPGEETGGYILATTADPDAKPGSPSGAIDGAFFPKKKDWPLQHPSIVVAVEDIAASAQAVDKAGGEVRGEPMSIRNVGLYVSFVDTEGNRISMLQPATGAGK